MRTFGFIIRVFGFVSVVVSVVLAVMVISQTKAGSSSQRSASQNNRYRFAALICLAAGYALDVAGTLVGRMG